MWCFRPSHTSPHPNCPKECSSIRELLKATTRWHGSTPRERASRNHSLQFCGQRNAQPTLVLLLGSHITTSLLRKASASWFRRKSRRAASWGDPLVHASECTSA